MCVCLHVFSNCKVAELVLVLLSFDGAPSHTSGISSQDGPIRLPNRQANEGSQQYLPTVESVPKEDEQQLLLKQLLSSI